MGILDNFLRRIASRKKAVALYFYQDMDLDLLLPVADALAARGVRVLALVDSKLQAGSPRTRAALASRRFGSRAHWPLSPRFIPALLGVAALVTACDTTARTHVRGRWLARLARGLGVRTFTLQHGLENIGLTYYDAEYPPQAVDFASEVIFTWGALSTLDARVGETIRARCVPVGRPRAAAESLPDLRPRFRRAALVAVFENLHWSRYSESYRGRFLADLEAAALTFPDADFLLKPHHLGRWLVARYGGRLPVAPNLLIVDPRDPDWEPFTAPALIRSADAVITTPSTTALDAAEQGKRTAVAAYDADARVYEPLTALRRPEDWRDFIARALGPDGSALEALSRRFLARVCLPGDGAARIAEHVAASSTGGGRG